MLSSRDFFRLIVEGEHLPGDIHSKIFTCVPYRLSWSSRIGGAVLLVGIRRARDECTRQRSLGVGLCGGNEERSRMMGPDRDASSARLLRHGASPTLVGDGIWDAGSYADFMWEIRSPALNEISRKLAYTCKTTSSNSNMKIAKRKNCKKFAKLTPYVRTKIVPK